jgi:poly(A)-specific ribonuclease
VSFPKGNSIVIKKFDEAKEALKLEQKKKDRKERIQRQVGFRYIVDAMLGRLHNIDLMKFAKNERGDAIMFDRGHVSARFNRAKHWLENRRPVLVGHNLFMDLMYFYRTFIGPLPDTVIEFSEKIHKLFPMVVDTKYMATHLCGNINPTSSLTEIETSLRLQPSPRIHMHKLHSKYAEQEAFHEAGYDSYLTARVMILLSAKLEAAGSYVRENPSESESDSYHTAVEPSIEDVEEVEAIDQQLGQGATKSGGPATNALQPDEDRQHDAQQDDAQQDIYEHSFSFSKKKKNKKKRRKASEGSDKTPTAPRFAHKNPFAQLEVDVKDASSTRSADSHSSQTDSRRNSSEPSSMTPSLSILVGAKSRKASSPIFTGTSSAPPSSSKPMKLQEAFALNPRAAPFFAPRRSNTIGLTDSNFAGDIQPLMPPFDCDFWNVYGNRLRVFGTHETFVDLDPEREGFRPQDGGNQEKDRVDLSKVKW